MQLQERIVAYFDACGNGTADEIAAHFTTEAVIYDTNLAPARGAKAIAAMWVKVRDRWGGAQWHVDTCVTDADTAEHHLPIGEPQRLDADWCR